jgi:formyl-CoA transferase
VEQPLGRYRALELGNWLSAPVATGILADFGADVIKVELPGEIDNSRRLGSMDPADPARSPYFVAVSRNKRSITLDVRIKEGRDLFLKLVAKSDVLISNFRPGTLERWSLGFDVLKNANPHIVLVLISGYGQEGPLSGR